MFSSVIRSGKTWMSGWWTRLAPVIAVASGSAALAAPTLLDFEDVAAGTTITTQYGSRGALFLQAYLDTDAAAHSGTQVLRSVPPTAEIFTPQPFVINFTSAQSRVKFFGGSQFASLNGTLTAFDTNNTAVATDGPRLVSQNTFTTAFEVTASSANIVRVEFQLEGTAFESIDDLEFEGEPPPPPPTQPPVVEITSPVNGADLDIDSIDIAGTATGQGLVSPAKLTIEWRRPPEQSAAPPFTSDLELVGAGTTRPFSLPHFTGLPLGPITVTVAAENFNGLKGTASSSFTNLPAAIRSRFTAEGGAARLGAFRFGLVLNGCKVAVYDHGAISDSGLLIKGAILTKWLSLTGPSNQTGWFGCPLNEEHGGPGGTAGPGGSTSQDFTGGRIYANLPGTAYVPAVFVDVLDTRELEVLGSPTSVPLADPVSPVEPVQASTNTWLYQQFIRPSRPDLVPATLEIRGSPPTLWVERQSPLTSGQMGALWDQYPCSDNLGPCPVAAPPSNFVPIPDAGDTYCGGVALHSLEGEYSVFVQCAATDLQGCGVGTPEWKNIKADEYLPTPIYGVVIDSHFADEDFIGSHEWGYCAPYPLQGGPLDPFDCPSDWNVKIAPIGPQPGVAPYQAIFAEGNDISDIGAPNSSSSRLVELEWERFYGDFVAWMDMPAVGDLMYAVGRWIVDCGHDNFAAELHPIYMYAKMKTVTSITDPFTGLVNNNPFGGQPATRADIWVNGWYPGGTDADHAIEFDIYPPPRPTPTARLVVNKPVDADAVSGVTLEWKLEPPESVNHVHVKFTAPYRENRVTQWGEVKWEINRGYEGQWYLYWSP
jgi:hypothetical protein